MKYKALLALCLPLFMTESQACNSYNYCISNNKLFYTTVGDGIRLIEMDRKFEILKLPLSSRIEKETKAYSCAMKCQENRIILKTPKSEYHFLINGNSMELMSENLGSSYLPKELNNLKSLNENGKTLVERKDYLIILNQSHEKKDLKPGYQHKHDIKLKKIASESKNIIDEIILHHYEEVEYGD